MNSHHLLPQRMDLPGTTVCAAGSSENLPAECARFGPRGLLVHGRSLSKRGKISKIAATAPAAMEIATWEHPGGEPTLRQLEKLLKTAREFRPDWIAAVGGGSVMDLAKGCAGLYAEHGNVTAYHDGAPITTMGLPFVAAPSTAGTGSEATKVSVLTNEETGIKKSFRSPHMMARLIVLDPGLLKGSPRHVIAHAGMDALTQAIESYTSTGATWFTRQLALRGAQLLFQNLVSAYESEGEDLEAAEAILTGSYLAGVALSSSRLGVVHGLAHPLGARYKLPHGLVCAACLPYVLTYNREAMGEDYEDLSRAAGTDLLAAVAGLLADLDIDNPFKGRGFYDLDGMIKEVLASGSTAHNPREVTTSDARSLIRELFTY
ncbi:iron-containing alcohol dehydrogenase family protein [Salidesulfovibrio onnuriiensis]|uniref:iron-containing alcohol dehydrogenase family protein n=1 Tax=Salidesulfovibrio onnuriiensis TaxID=2583823 RepID=UPI00164FB977|nr:iron-containing alcohol dehydrogenase [Salidesulfovibrio onnuriiensis]